MKILILLLLTLNIASAADPYFEIKSVRIREIPIEKALLIRSETDWGNVIQMTRDLVALGQDVYNLVKLSQPTVQTNLPPISVVPAVEGNIIFEIEKWKGPRIKQYEFVMENMLGLDVVTFTYKVHYFYGGSYQGKGEYIKGFAVVPDRIQVLMGYDLDANLSLVEIANKGTSESPKPSMTAVLRMKVDGPVDIQEFSHFFMVQGDGTLIQY